MNRQHPRHAAVLNVLFLCTGNSCRSQMAEGWARRLGGDTVEVQSAGIESHGKNPRAIEVMGESFRVLPVSAAVLDLSSRSDIGPVADKLAGQEVDL